MIPIYTSYVYIMNSTNLLTIHFQLVKFNNHLTHIYISCQKYIPKCLLMSGDGGARL